MKSAPAFVALLALAVGLAGCHGVSGGGGGVFSKTWDAKTAAPRYDVPPTPDSEPSVPLPSSRWVLDEDGGGQWERDDRTEKEEKAGNKGKHWGKQSDRDDGDDAGDDEEEGDGDDEEEGDGDDEKEGDGDGERGDEDEGNG